MITAGSLFSGIDAPALAFERCGVQTLWASEIDPQAVSVHARHFPRTYQLGDVHGVNNRNAAPVDIVVGGSPCQNFSQSGNQLGLEGAESRLFEEYIRVVRELRPAFAIWENVPGAFSTNAGRDFASVIGAFYECGCRQLAWRVLDAQYFGVPQRRRRIFIVADFRGERAGEILFERSSTFGDCPEGGKAGADIAYALTTSNQRYDAKNQETFVGVTAIDARNARESGLTPTLQDGTSLNSMPLIAGTLRAGGAGLQYASTNNQDRVYSIEGLSPALTAQGYSHAHRILEDRVRRLMPVECERLMGFPDGWTQWDANNKELTDTPRYRMLGNSIAVPVIEWIARRMVEVL